MYRFQLRWLKIVVNKWWDCLGVTLGVSQHANGQLVFCRDGAVFHLRLDLIADFDFPMQCQAWPAQKTWGQIDDAKDGRFCARHHLHVVDKNLKISILIFLVLYSVSVKFANNSNERPYHPTSISSICFWVFFWLYVDQKTTNSPVTIFDSREARRKQLHRSSCTI